MAIPWQRMRNPVYERPGWSVKDACMARSGGWYYLFFSAFFYDRGRERSHVAGVRTRDFLRFSQPLFIWDGREDGWIGLCSPDIKRWNDGWVLTFNSWGDKPDQPNQLFYATSTDLQRWTPSRPLAPSLTRGIRAIDATVANWKGQTILHWKERQSPWFAVGSALDADDFTRIGQPYNGEVWMENAQLISIDGKWHMLVSAREPFRGGSGMRPWLMALTRDPVRPEDWIEWDEPIMLDVPLERFNTDHRSNAAFLADWRAEDGWFYLLYAGRTNPVEHLGRGDNRLGLARSRDLRVWYAPGG